MIKDYIAYIHLYGFCVLLASIVTMIVMFIVLTFSNYQIQLQSNLLNEHYIELTIWITGLISFLYTYDKVIIKFRKLIH